MREDVMAALLDSPNAQRFDPNADPDWDTDENRCGAYGPGGECCRTLGHVGEEAYYRPGVHISYDTDHRKDWPVGWRSAEDRLKLVQSANFAPWIEGSDDFMAGFHAALRLVRHAVGQA